MVARTKVGLRPAFLGGLCAGVDGVYGHQYLARENVSNALATKVNDGLCGLDRAQEIAHDLFCENPVRIFKI